VAGVAVEINVMASAFRGVVDANRAAGEEIAAIQRDIDLINEGIEAQDRRLQN